VRLGGGEEKKINSILECKIESREIEIKKEEEETANPDKKKV
jgi:hypothetical protein